jgi:hypothetical protein
VGHAEDDVADRTDGDLAVLHLPSDQVENEDQLQIFPLLVNCQGGLRHHFMKNPRQQALVKADDGLEQLH